MMEEFAGFYQKFRNNPCPPTSGKISLMRQPLLRLAGPLLFAGSLLLQAQDASLVLRTSVGYRTQLGSLPLSDEQQKKADQLGQDAQRAAAAGKFADAMRDYYQGLAIMRGIPWTPAYALAASLQAKLDHALIAPGGTATLTLAPLYTTDGAPKILASVFLVPAKKETGNEKSLATGLAIDPAALSFSSTVTVPPGVNGDYSLEVRLASEGEEPVAAARPALTKTVPVHIEGLSGDAQHLRDRLAKAGKHDGSALPTAEYALVLYERADRGEINPHRYNFHDEFSNANQILDQLDSGHDPFAGKRGDTHKAYRSAVDQTLQPYRLLIPKSYDGTKPMPLLVALHGMGGDENSMFDAYKEGLLKREAERDSFLVVCPKGRDSASMYRGSAEQDVLDVISEVERDYKVDLNRVYLMGHSMGGYGTWSIAMDHPDMFAALGPISGGGNPAGMVKLRSIPEYVVHGDNDKTVPVTQSRTMVEAGKKAGANITYVEIPGGSHVDVAAPQFAPMLDFFAKQSRHSAETATQ
jgi:pimeloyl-ACP methyl ester carboxylesterase